MQKESEEGIVKRKGFKKEVKGFLKTCKESFVCITANYGFYALLGNIHGKKLSYFKIGSQPNPN